MDIQVFLELKVLLVYQVYLVHKAHLARSVHRVSMESQDKRVKLVCQEFQAHQALRV